MIGGTHGKRRALALMLAWGAATLGLTAWAPAPAEAATISVSLTMTSLELSGRKPTDRVSFTGTVTNTGDLPAYGVQVILWRSRDPIRDLPTLRRASTESVWGARLPITTDHYEVITTSLAPFAPGATRQVELRATLADLGFDTPGAAYAFGADVIASSDRSTSYATVGQVRTFVPVPAKQPVPLTSIVLLSAPPTKLMDDLFSNDGLAAQLGGRLDNLLTAATRTGMSWLIDPALLDEVQDMADGYQVVDGGGRTVAGSGQQVAAAWLARFDRLDPAAGGRTLFASPDLNGARIADDERVLERAQEAADEVDDVADLPLVVVPSGAAASAATYDYLADSGAAAIVAGNAAQAGALQAGTGLAMVLATSNEIPTATDTPAIERRQQALAAAVIAGSAGQARLLSSLSDLAQDEVATADWLQRRHLGELLATAPAETPAALLPVENGRLSKSQFADLTRLELDIAAYGDLVPESEFTDQADAALSRAAASAWVGNANGFKEHLGGLNQLVGPPAVQRAVSLDASARFLMSSRTNQFPVTVTNNLTETIRVQVVFTTDNPQRLRVPPSDVVSVQPGQSETVNVRPEATANGLVIARAHVATENGHRVTRDTAITIEVTDLGMVAWIIVGVSSLVLVGATAWRIRQVRRRDASTEAGA